MNQARGAQEPTMEEILSSIRRIISEDGKRVGEGVEEAPAAAPPPAAAPAPAAPLSEWQAEQLSLAYSCLPRAASCAAGSACVVAGAACVVVGAGCGLADVVAGAPPVACALPR